MKILLDTNVLLWWLSDDARLDDGARIAINKSDNDVVVSIVSLWEIAIKVRIGKLKADLNEIEQILDQEGVSRLGVSSAHLRALGGLPTHHRDPFDHLLMAQAIVEDAVFLTGDRAAMLYPVKVQEAWRG